MRIKTLEAETYRQRQRRERLNKAAAILPTRTRLKTSNPEANEFVAG
jgi:hypothetical protein